MKPNVREIVVFGMLGAVMYASKVLMEAFPNVHLLGVFTIALTLVYRRKALYPIYTYVLINGIFAGFSLWWIPYLYLWGLLWAAAMLLPRDMELRWKKPVCMAVTMALCGAHGFLFGTLYAPFQAIMFHLSWKGMLAWIVAGLPWDFVHGVGNICCGVLILPLAATLRYCNRLIGIRNITATAPQVRKVDRNRPVRKFLTRDRLIRLSHKKKNSE